MVSLLIGFELHVDSHKIFETTYAERTRKVLLHIAQGVKCKLRDHWSLNRVLSTVLHNASTPLRYDGIVGMPVQRG